MATHLTNPELPPDRFAGKESKHHVGLSEAVNSALARPLHFSISSRMNAIVDFSVAFLLFVGAAVGKFNDPAIIPMLRAMGSILIFYSLGTRYELGLVKFIPLQVHLFLDLGMAALLGAAPIHFGITGLAGFMMVALGAVMLAIALLTRREQKFMPGIEDSADSADKDA